MNCFSCGNIVPADNQIFLCDAKGHRLEFCSAGCYNSIMRPEDSFGNRLKHIRLTLGLSQGELSDLVGITPALFSHFETGRRDPSLKSIVKICKALNIRPNAIIPV